MAAELQDYLIDLKEKTKQYEIEFAAQREQNETLIIDTDGNKISSLEFSRFPSKRLLLISSGTT